MRLKTLALSLSALFFATAAIAEDLKMAVTTSFANSGLAEILLPQIAADTGINVQLLIVGTGQALKLGEAGDVDAVLVHARAAEEAFLAAGNATHRREIMYNDFIIVGPSADPAGAAAASKATEASFARDKPSAPDQPPKGSLRVIQASAVRPKTSMTRRSPLDHAPSSGNGAAGVARRPRPSQSAASGSSTATTGMPMVIQSRKP